MNHILLTGASSDLGKALALALVQETYKLKETKKPAITLTARSKDILEDIKQSLMQRADVNILPLDLLIEKERQILIEWIHTHVPDLVINSAGSGLYGNALFHPIQEQIDILELNARVVLELSLHSAQSLLSHKKQGIIVNISSATDALVYPTFSVYAASKSFVTSFSQSFDEEMAPYNIRILTSAPGPLATKFKAHASKGYSPHPAKNALSCEEAAEHIVQQIKRKKRYQVFPRTTQIGRALARTLLPASCRYRLLKGFLKHSYKNNSL